MRSPVGSARRSARLRSMAPGAQARKFDHLRARREADRLRNLTKALRRSLRGHFTHRPATIANKENRWFMHPMAMIAGHEGVARVDPVDQPILDQKIESPIDRDGRWTLARACGQTVDHLIGAERAAGGA